MLNKRLITNDIQDFVIEKSNTNTDISALVLSKNSFPEVAIQEIAVQINGRQKALKKFPLWAITKGCYYPPNLNLEQTSSEITARYKSTLVEGNTLVDVTGGFGIDDYYFSLVMQQIIHCELNADLSTIAAHNFTQINALNIQCITGDGLEILQESNEKIDWIYIDPSRRDTSKNKVFFLKDCLPDVPENLDFIFKKCTNILLKTAPLLDIKAGLRSLKHVKEIHIVAVQNDVKEILWILENGYSKDPIVKTKNFTTKNEESFQFNFSEELLTFADFSLPLTYLYEPNGAILKSGAFSSVAKNFAIDKLHVNTHLYTSTIYIHEFPGRIFKIIKTIPYNKKSLKQLGLTKANITVRNFPESVPILRKKFKIKDGGTTYVFFTTLMNSSKAVLICEKTSE